MELEQEIKKGIYMSYKLFGLSDSNVLSDTNNSEDSKIDLQTIQ